jgi:hypothetical protein
MRLGAPASAVKLYSPASATSKKVSSAARCLISLEYRYDPSADDDVLKTEEG